MAWLSQILLRTRRIRSIVPSALIFLITVIILCEQQPGVQGDCQVLCSETYCACVGGQCAVDEDVPETTPVGTGLFNVSVDSGATEIRISMQTGDADDLGVDGFEVFVSDMLDYETVEEYVFIIDCYDGTSWSSEPDSLRHTMRVEDVNEFEPDFNVSIIYASILENADTGTALITDVPIKASDGDPRDTGFEYSILEDAPFDITEGCQDGEVFLSVDGTVDFEIFKLYSITIVAEDGCRSGFDSLEGNVTVIVQVNDTDDEPPEFDQDNYNVTIPERNQIFFSTNLSASDGDSLDAPLQYSFIGQSGDWGCLDYLRIDNETGEVTLAKELDYETSLTPCIITVQAVQQDNCEMVGTTSLTVTVTDVNECPSIILDNYTGQLNYDDPFVITDDGSERLTIDMIDEDLIFSGNVTIEPSNLVELVEITGTKGSQTRSYFIKFLDPTSIMTDTEIQIFLSDKMTDVYCDITTSNVTVRLMPDSLAPNFTQIDYYGNVLENATEGTFVTQLEALNSEITSDGIVYRLQMASDGGEYIFSVDDASGVVSVAMNDSLDAEFITQYTLIIEAVDERGTYYRSSITSVIIDVIDVNEYPPMFAEDVMKVVEEEVPLDFPILTVQANDLDVDAALQYSIKETDVPFKINAGTGEITTNGTLDRDEGITTYNLTVTVTDGINEDQCLVNITLTDINDNAPEFIEVSFELSLAENTTNATTIEIEATDIDEGDNAEIVYMLQTPPNDDKFSVDEETGMLYANGPFDYEDMKEYTLVIRASDGKFATLTTVAVTITDVNDNAPVFTTACSTTEVPEDAENDVICTVLAEDADDDGEDEVMYSLNTSTVVPFTVEPSTGEIKVIGELDRETEDHYTFIIIAEDSGQPPFSTNITINVTVLDVNDEEPKFVDTSISIRRQENELADPPVLLESVKATDKDLPPWNTIQCEKTSEGESFLVVTGQDGSCDIYTSEALTTYPDPYKVSFYAFNPDNRDRHSENVTLSVDVRDTVCYVIFVNEDDYDVIVSQSNLDTSTAVVTLNITSNCNTDDIVFDELRQWYQLDMMDDERLSQNFTIDDQTGEISPTNNVMEGKHVLLVSAYNQSDPEVNETTTVSIVVTGLNQAPEFGLDVYTVNITTDSMLLIIDLSNNAIDYDSPSFATGEMIFSEVSETEFNSGNISDYFQVNLNGKVTTTTENLNNIKEGTFRLVVMVMDKAIDPLNDTAVVLINIDIDQAIPVVDPPEITKDCDGTVKIEEEIDPPQHICDIDAYSDEQIVFGLESASEYFIIDPDSGEITTLQRFDYENDERSYMLLVYAEGTTSELRSYNSITVSIIDINDNKPDFSESQREFSMEENRYDESDCTTFIGRIQSTDADSEINQNVTYETDHEDFEVRGNNLTAVKCISRNDIAYSNGEVEVNIIALNIGVRENQTSYFRIVITIEDLNDQTPEFKNDLEDFSVNVEVLISGLLVFTGNAEDKDKGPYNNASVFSLTDGQEDLIYSLFQMSSDGELTVRDTTIISDEILNKTDKYEITVMVTDKGQPPLSSSEKVTVYVGIFDLTKPYFAFGERTQTFEVEENRVNCANFPAPLTCSGTESVYYELDVDPISGEKYFFLNNETANELCIRDLDREVSSLYTVYITAYYEDPDICNSTDRTTRKRREVREVGSNIIVFTITVIDAIDSPPSLQFPGNVSSSAYYLAAIDSTKFGSPVFTVTAKDEDATWEFLYTLSSLSDGPGPSDTIVIDESTGQITTNSLLYTWLSESGTWEWQNSTFDASLTQDHYIVKVCDVLSPSETQCDTAELTFKILLSFEHIIIRFNTPVTSIIPQQNDIISCIAQKMDPTHQLELNLQFLSPDDGISSPDQYMTDMWLYGVDTSKLPSSPYLTFEEFEKMWNDADGVEECSDVEMTATRLQLSKIIPDSSTSSMEAWVPIALGIIVFIGNLICIVLLLVSWRTMMEDSGRELARELTLKDNEVEKGFTNPVFHYDNGAYDATEIMATEAAEDASGSEDTLITRVYLTDGKTQSTIAMTASDEPKDVEKAVGTDDDVLVLPPPPNIRDYDSEEEILDVYPFDEPDESYEFNVDVQSDTVDIKTTPNDANDSAIIPDVASSSTDPTLPIPPADYETEAKNREGVESEESEEKKNEDQKENDPLSEQKKPEAPPKPTDHTPKDESMDGKVKNLMSELESHFNKEQETKTTPNDSNDYPTTPNVESSETDPTLPMPVVENTTEPKQRDETEHEEKKNEEKAPEEVSNSDVEPDEILKDYDYPPPPVPLVVQETGEDPVPESPLKDQVEDPPLPPPPPPILPPIDYADGKTVTFGGETIVGEGAGDGGSTTASEATEDTNQPRKSSRDAFLSEIERVAASFGGNRSNRFGNRNIGLNNGAVGSPPPSPRSVGESEGESIGFLDDESLISASEIGVTSL